MNARDLREEAARANEYEKLPQDEMFLSDMGRLNLYKKMCENTLNEWGGCCGKDIHTHDQEFIHENNMQFAIDRYDWEHEPEAELSFEPSEHPQSSLVPDEEYYDL